MKLEDQVCSLELAKKLKELGVKQESAFYWKPCGCGDDTHHKLFLWSERLNTTKSYSAFTVGELGEILKNYESWSFYLRNQWCCNEGGGHLGTWREYASTEADARAKMLIHLIKTGVVKP